MQFGAIAFFLLAASFLFENMGFFTHEMNLFCGVVALGAAVRCYLPRPSDPDESPRTLLCRGCLAGGIAAVILGLGLLPGEVVARGTGLVLIVLGIHLLFRAFGRRRPELRVLTITFAAYTFFMMFERYVPGVWYGLQGLSEAVCRVVGYIPTLVGQTPDVDGSGIAATLWERPPMAARSTFTNLHTVILFGIFYACAAAFSEPRDKSEPRTLARFTAMLVGWRAVAVSLVAFIWLFNNAHVIFNWTEPVRAGTEKLDGFFDHSLKQFVNDHFPVSFPVVLVGLCLLGLFLFSRRYTFRPGSTSPSMRGFACAGAGVLLALLAVTMVARPLRVEVKDNPKILFYDRGLVNFQTPSYGRWGATSGGMYGNLPRRARALGFRAETTKRDERRQSIPLSAADLEGVDALVVVNPQDPEDVNNPYDTGTYDMIMQWVKDGGSLLLMADHTMREFRDLKDKKVEEGQEEQVGWEHLIYTNELIRDTSIEFEFDSGHYFIGGWLHSYRYAAHPLTMGMGDRENDLGTTIGCSIKCSYPAVPLVVGNWGYSDPGDPRRGPSYLDSPMNYDCGEPLGDVILGAAQPYGKGKIVVFADTTSMWNFMGTANHTFQNRLLTYLVSNVGQPASPFEHFLGFVWVGGIFVLLGLSGGRSVAVVAPLFAALVLCAAFDAGTTSAVERIPKSVPEAVAEDGTTAPEVKISYVDFAHGNRITKESWREPGAMGLHLNLMRNNYLSMNMEKFDADRLKEADLYTIIAPTGPFSRRERGEVLEFIQNGGMVMITAGYEQYGPIKSLLDDLGLALSDVPLGRFQRRVDQAGTNVMFWEIWPITYDDEKFENSKVDEIFASESFYTSGGLYRLSADLGTVLWREQVGGAAPAAPVVVPDGDAAGVYLVSGGVLDPITQSSGDVVAFTLDGKIKWRARVGKPANDPSRPHGDKIVSPAVGQPIYRIGQPILQKPVVEPDGSVLVQTQQGYAARIIGGELSRIGTGDGMVDMVAMGGRCTLGPNGVYYSDFSNTGLTALRLSGTASDGALPERTTLDRLWNFGKPGQFFGEPTVGPDGTVYALQQQAGGSCSLYAFHPNHAETKWVVEDAGEIRIPVSPGPDGRLLKGMSDKSAALFAEGERKWTFDAPGFVVLPAAWGDDGRVYIASVNLPAPGTTRGSGTLTALSPDGEKLWDCEFDDSPRRGMAVGPDGTVYVPTKRGWLLAIGNVDGEGQVMHKFGGRFERYTEPVVGPDGSVFVAVQQMAYPVIVKRPIGDKGGGVVLVGDSGFLLNQNLEGKDEDKSRGRPPHEAAINFFKWLVQNKLNNPMKGADVTDAEESNSGEVAQ